MIRPLIQAHKNMELKTIGDNDALPVLAITQKIVYLESENTALARLKQSALRQSDTEYAKELADEIERSEALIKSLKAVVLKSKTDKAGAHKMYNEAVTRYNLA